MSPQRLYDTAYADYTAGQWSLAIQGFETYLEDLPEVRARRRCAVLHRRVVLRGQQVPEAVEAYERVIRNYPHSDILPEAYYKGGISYERLGQPDKAREACEYVVKNYPDSDAGRTREAAPRSV